jgi:hypothetical protein
MSQACAGQRDLENLAATPWVLILVATVLPVEMVILEGTFNGHLLLSLLSGWSHPGMMECWLRGWIQSFPLRSQCPDSQSFFYRKTKTRSIPRRHTILLAYPPTPHPEWVCPWKKVRVQPHIYNFWDYLGRGSTLNTGWLCLQHYCVNLPFLSAFSIQFGARQGSNSSMSCS